MLASLLWRCLTVPSLHMAVCHTPHRYRNSHAYRITQCYLPPGRLEADIPAFTPANLVLNLATLEGCKAELTPVHWWFVISLSEHYIMHCIPAIYWLLNSDGPSNRYCRLLYAAVRDDNRLLLPESESSSSKREKWATILNVSTSPSPVDILCIDLASVAKYLNTQSI